MRMNLKKLGAVVAGAALLASSVAFAGLYFGDTELVNNNGEVQAKVVVGANAKVSDGVAAAYVAAALANNAYKERTLTAEVDNPGTCVGGANESSVTCNVTDETVTLEIVLPGFGNKVHAFNMLISEHTDLELDDRDTLYANSGDHLNVIGDLVDDEQANPFGDQVMDDTTGVFDTFSTYAGGYDAYRIWEKNYQPFETTAVSSTFGKSVKEYQRFYVEGYTEHDSGDVYFVPTSALYTIVFDGQGLPLCPGDEGTTYDECSAPQDLASARFTLDILGERWVITDFSMPTGANFDAGDTDTQLNSADEVGLVNGAVLKIAKEANYDVVNVGECLTDPNTGVSVCLADISHGTTSENLWPAVLNFYGPGKDPHSNVTPDKQDQIFPGDSKEVIIGDNKVRVHVYQTAPGTYFFAKWAEMAIISNEIKLESGKKLSQYLDTTEDSYYNVYMGFTASTGSAFISEKATHLKELLFFNDNVEDYFSDSRMSEGDRLWAMDVEPFKRTYLEYDGLQSFSEVGGSTTLRFEPVNFDRTVDVSYHAGVANGDVIDYANKEVIKISSTNSDAKFRMPANGDMVTEFYYLPKEDLDSDGDSVGELGTGEAKAIMWRDPDDATKWYIDEAQPIQFRYADGTYGWIVLEDGAVDTDYGYVDGSSNLYDIIFVEGIDDYSDGSLPAMKWWDAVIFLAEEDPAVADDLELLSPTGEDDKVEWHMGDSATVYTNFNSWFAATAGTTVTGGLYGYTDDSSYREGDLLTMRGTDYARGSPTKREFVVPADVRRVKFLYRPAAEVSTENVEVYTLREGDNVTVGDITIRVRSIDEVVVPSVSGGAGAGTPTGATAVIKEGDMALGATVNVRDVQTVSPADLVALDSEVTDTGTLITIGGPVVNTVTAAAMQESGDVLTPENNVIVKQVGNKIVVAGYTADDTLQAVRDFLAQLERR